MQGLGQEPERLRARERSVRRARIGAAAIAVAAATAIIVARPSFASDHLDAPSLADDPRTDIGDVYAFMRPGGTTHLVLAMTVHPRAPQNAVFDPRVEYVFHVLGYDPAAGVIDPTLAQAQIACRFLSVEGAPQRAVCSANGFATERGVGPGDAGPGSADVRVFAGLRADPAFADVAAVNATLTSGQLKLTNPGTNAFAGQNTLAIVVEVDVDKVLLPGSVGARPLFAVSASTERVK